MKDVASRITRSLTPALRGDRSYERLYSQPPSPLRVYEWVPIVAALVSTALAWAAQTLAADWIKIWLPVAAYYLYLIADLAFIRPSREAKWLRNSMPVWLILAWHYWLTGALNLHRGEQNLLLVVTAVAAFFAYFWEDYYTMQKFVRGLVVVYYISLIALLRWDAPLGVFVSVSTFILAFSLWHQTFYYRATVAVMALALAFALYQSNTRNLILLLFAGIGIAAIAYLQTFIGAAYDIRKGGQIAS
jgi:hypothetical protein